MRIIVIIMMLALSGCGETWYGMRRLVDTNASITKDCIVNASHQISGLDDFKFADGKTVPELSYIDQKVTRFYFSRRYEYVYLDLYQDKNPALQIHFGHVDYGFLPSKGRIERKKILLEEVMKNILESCGISKDQIKVKQECQNIKCDL